MKRNFRIAAIFLAITLLLSVLSGCSGPTGGASATSAASTADSGATSNKPFEGQNIVLFSFAGWLDESIEKTVSDRLQEDTGMTVEYIVVPWDERITKMSVMVAGGEQIDVTGKSTPADMSILCDAGALLPVNEYINNSEVFSKENWLGWDYMEMMAYAGDGQWYGVPTFPPQGYIFNVNQAWLDELKLEIPTTTQELTEVLRAFKKADFGGNGATIPIAHQFPNSDHIATFLGMWGVEGPYIMKDGADGKRYHPWLAKNALAGLQWMQDIYKEGLLDPEFANENGTTMFDKVKSGLVGVCLDWPGTNRGWNLGAAETGAKVNMVPMAIPQAKADVTPVNCGNSIIMNNMVSTTANPDAAWAFIEWLSSPEGIVDWTWTEGQNYTKTGDETEIIRTQLHSTGWDTQNCLNKAFLSSANVEPAFPETLEGYDIFFESWAFPPVLEGAGDAEEIALPLATKVIVGQMSVSDFEAQLREQLMNKKLIDK